jgi:uncharacterized cupredoxin-like copper-binding protein
MIRKWYAMALPVLALAIAMSGVLPTKVWSEDADQRFLWKLLPVEKVEPLPTKMLSIVLGATITPMLGTEPAGKGIYRVYPKVTQYIDIDEDGAELDRVAIVAPARLNLVEGQKYQLKIINASASTHYFWAPEFDELSAKTTQISVDKGKVGHRVTGGPEEEYLTAETEIRPGGTAVWEFVPQMAGKFKWGCSIPSHADAGMKGEFVVTPAMTG